MVATVRIKQWPKPIALEPGQIVLEAALNAGIPYPFGCQSGNCGACKSMLIEGKVELAEYSEFALTDEEKAVREQGGKEGSSYENNKAIESGGQKFGWAKKDGKDVLVKWGSVAGIKNKDGTVTKTPGE